jgi:dipeptidyl aminopeptidase/acylaminoacyl peptidase
MDAGSPFSEVVTGRPRSLTSTSWTCEKEGAPDATTQLTFDRRRITDLRWMPDGRSLIIASDRDEQRRLLAGPSQ